MLPFNATTSFAETLTAISLPVEKPKSSQFAVSVSNVSKSKSSADCIQNKQYHQLQCL